MTNDNITKILEIVKLAESHVNDSITYAKSAKLCLEDAYSLIQKNNYISAGYRALFSMHYSIGLHHPDYQKSIEIYNKIS